jgi:NAD(P)-dependent dehydrogenase (short-subunit alcohol dehydrogenase family)
VNDLGATVAGAGSDPRPAHDVCDEIAARGGVAVASTHDVADFAAAADLVGTAVESFGRLDILVNNAGILREQLLADTGEDDWDDVVRVHLRGHFAPTRHAAAYWRDLAGPARDAHRCVINTSSPSGLFGTIGHSGYGAAKAGIAAFTLVAAQELASAGVTVNCIAPSGRTRMTWSGVPHADAAGGYDPLDPAHNAALVVALAGEQGASITGQVFFVYGGTVTLMQPWQGGARFHCEAGWDADALAGALLAAYPHGLAAATLAERLAEAGGPLLDA